MSICETPKILLYKYYTDKFAKLSSNHNIQYVFGVKLTSYLNILILILYQNNAKYDDNISPCLCAYFV